MNTREQFGKYLLLKKLTEDPLGETFRAGLLGDNGMERVALLRIFNGQGVDGSRLWQATKERVGLQKTLRSPNIGEGIDIGQIEGIPFVAYDYISGKNLATLLEQAARQQNFIPPDHALLITERVALGLAAASESRFGGERILHGFVSPHLVMISNEGESRLLGFEVSRGLRNFAANPVIRQHFGRYLAPEALSGADPHQSDDIYSLGVVLFELLTGRPLPPPGPDGFASVIDRGVVATESGPIAEDLRDLLKRSLVPRDQRIQDVSSWHKALNKWMLTSQHNPTTFNLAFFMHNLFRQDIERESQEIEVERTLPLPVVQKAAEPEATPPAADPLTGAVPTAAAPAAAAASSGGTGVHEVTKANEKTENFIPEYAREPKKSKTGLFVGLAILLLALLGGGFYFFSQQSSEAATPASPAAAPPPPPPEEPAGPSEEEIMAQINDMITKRATEMEEELKKSYDDQLEDLQAQLEVAKKEAEERKQREKELEEQKAAEEEAARLAAEEEAARIAAEEEAARLAAEEEEAARIAAEEEAARLAAEEATKAAAAPPPPPKPQVRRGDLVKMGPGVIAPKVIRRPKPRFPPMAKRFQRKSAKVLIKVLIDENGDVAKAELDGEKQGYGFDEEALNSAKKATYRPATVNGVPVKIWQTLSIEFRDQ